MAPRCCALNTGSDFHLLDHIAPLASLMQMPLIVTEEKNFALANKFYPFVKTRYEPYLEQKLKELAKEFDVLFECKYWAPHLRSLFKDLYGKEMRLIFCPHGQSDKGYRAPLLIPYTQQDGVLLYGDLHIEMLQELGIWPLSRFAVVGNYRKAYYLKYRKFYDALAQKEIFAHLDPQKPLLLYAPTWNDAEQNSSFFTHVEKLLSQMPSSWNLLIKVHPLLEQREPTSFYSLSLQRANTRLVSEFPPVFPLLVRADALLTDASSVGYDFLSFEKPLLFLPTNRDLPSDRLRSCGRVLPQEIASFLNKKNPLRSEQRELNLRAFGKARALESVRKTIFESLLY